MSDKLIIVRGVDSFDEAYNRVRRAVMDPSDAPRGRRINRVRAGAISMWGRPDGSDRPWALVTDGPLHDMKERARMVGKVSRWVYVLVPTDQDANDFECEEL